ncbi:unannotated protein [freshwater metagenome]|uniref:Unannotated protein n=1 Tax=freshwater metagenome TaxID=449393 RepID=A0A6J6SWU7_9ZZZZ
MSGSVPKRTPWASRDPGSGACSDTGSGVQLLHPSLSRTLTRMRDEASSGDAVVTPTSPKSSVLV